MERRKIAEGAEAVIYESRFLDTPCIVKERIEKEYRNKLLDEKIRKERTLNEARIIALASSNNINAPFVFLISRYAITMYKIEGTNLNILMEDKIESELIRKVAVQLAKLHNINIAHGDFTPANIIVDKYRNPYIIDFGLAEITPSIEEKALDILLMKRSISRSEFNIFLEEYKKEAKKSKEILERLREIETRGRYQIRSLV